MPLDKNDLRKLYQNNIDYNLIVTCYHEAGHIVLALRNIILPKACQVMKGKRIVANTTLVFLKTKRSEPIRRHRAKLLQRANTYAAGIAAEEMLFNNIVGKPLPTNLREGWAGDRDELQKVLISLEPRTYARTRLRKKIHTSVRSQIKSDWPIIINLAHALYDKKTLTYKQISDVVIRSVPKETAQRMRKFLKALEQAYSPKTLP